MSRLNRPFVAVVWKLGEGMCQLRYRSRHDHGSKLRGPSAIDLLQLYIHHLGPAFLIKIMGCGSPVLKVSDHDRHAMNLSPVPLKIRLLGQRCTLSLPRAKTSFRWCDVVVRRGGASSSVVHVT
ncbi:hypothetical protein TNCV_2000731 [Trichonephila clavipes]|nr:hypothetical protein TNCV_2000731 [Trichonephila clavipes]